MKHKSNKLVEYRFNKNAITSEIISNWKRNNLWPVESVEQCQILLSALDDVVQVVQDELQWRKGRMESNGSIVKYIAKVIKEERSKLREIEVTDPELQKKIQEMARLSDEIDRLKAQMEQLQSEFKPLEKEIRGILDEMDATAERALEFGNLLVTIKKRGYEAQSIQWKPLFEELYKKVNKAMKSQMDVMKAEHTKMKTVASQIGVQRTEASLSGVWNKLKGVLQKGLSFLKRNGSVIDKELSKLKQLVNRKSEGRLKEEWDSSQQTRFFREFKILSDKWKQQGHTVNIKQNNVHPNFLHIIIGSGSQAKSVGSAVLGKHYDSGKGFKSDLELLAKMFKPEDYDASNYQLVLIDDRVSDPALVNKFKKSIM